MAEDTVSQQPDGSGAFEPGPGVPAIRVLQLEDNPLDAEYAAALSADSVPTLVEALPTLP